MIRRAVLAVVGVVAILVLLLTLLLGTERGTRWALNMAAEALPLEINIADVSGTFLSVIEIPLIRYRDGDRDVAIHDVSVNIDWTAMSFTNVAIERLAARQVNLTSLSEQAPEPTPLEFGVPELPIRIAVTQIDLGSLQLDDILIEAIALSEVRARGRELQLGAASATVAQVSAAVQNVKVDFGGGVPLSGDFDWQLAGSRWSGSGAVSGSLVSLDVQHQLEGDAQIATRGSIQLWQRIDPVFDLVNEFSELRYADWTASDGQVQLTGTLDAFKTSFASTVAGASLPSATIRGTATGSLQGLVDLNAAVDVDAASLHVLGDIAWAPAFSLDIAVASSGIDPSNFATVPAGALDAELRLRASSVEDFLVDVVSLTGQWNGRATSAFGLFSRQGTSWRCDGCRVSVGNNLLLVNGGLSGRTIDSSIDIEAPALDQLWPGIAGSLRSEGQLRGSLSLPVLSGHATGNKLAFNEWSLGELSVASTRSTAQDMNVAVTIADLARADTIFGGGRLEFAGELENFAVSVDWLLHDYAATADLRLVVEDEGLSGAIDTATLSEPISGTWKLDQTTDFVIRPDTQRLAAASWSNGDASLRHEEVVLGPDLKHVAASLSNVPLDILNFALPDNIRIEGRLDATVDLQYGVLGWNGELDWSQRDTVLRFIATDDEYAGKIAEARASLFLENNAATLNAFVVSEQGTQAQLEASLTELSSEAGLHARLRLSGERWAWVPRLFPEIDDFGGSIRSDIVASGPVLSPDLQGELTLSNGAVAIPGLNLPLQDINLKLSGSSSGDDMAIKGEARSGDGVVSLDGRLLDVTSNLPSLNLHLVGDRATLLNWEDYLLIASPDLEFSGDLTGIHVGGSVAMDKADIRVRKLPEGAVSPSDDVAVEGREVAAPNRIRVSGEVALTLGKDIHVSAFGLDTNLEGQLRFIVAEGREPQGVGELRLVGGVFEAYGQKLEIETGTMVFTGPLDDPLINVRAIRKIESIDNTVIAGIELTGRTTDLQSRLFSDPSMSQADTLSYLVIGRPLADATAADGSNLSDSAYSLGLRQAAQITNQIGQTVGLDEFRVDGKNQNTTELIAGKHVNSRLYARYAFGVFSRIGKLLLRYKLNDSFAVEIGAGEHQSMDILYTIEKE